MFKQMFIIALVFGVLLYSGLYIYQHLLLFNYGDQGLIDYQTKQLSAQDTNIMYIKSCTKGPIPYIGNFFGARISSDPISAKLRRGRTFRIINKDKVSHTLSLGFTNLSKEVSPEDHWDVNTNDLPNIGTWSIKCDSINIKDGSFLVLLEAF